MATYPTSKPFFHRLQLALAGARFLSFSLLVHVVLVILAGSAVIMHVQQPAADFTAGDSSIVSTDLPSEQVDASRQGSWDARARGMVGENDSSGFMRTDNRSTHL